MNKFSFLSQLLQKGFYLAKTDVSYEELLQFIQLLRPVDVSIPLVRFGSPNDGGYLLPDDLHSIRALLSAGVGDNSDFEYFFASNDIPVCLFDASVETPARIHPLFFFFKKFIGNPCRERFISLDQAVSIADDQINNYQAQYQLNNFNSFNGQPDYVLSMDIEGYELEALLEASDECLNRFRILTLELHFLHRVLHEPILLLYKTLLSRLRKYFYVCHLHPTNAYKPLIYKGIDIPVNVELTLIHKSRVHHIPAPLNSITHALDSPSILSKPDIKLSTLYCLEELK